MCRLTDNRYPCSLRRPNFDAEHGRNLPLVRLTHGVERETLVRDVHQGANLVVRLPDVHEGGEPVSEFRRDRVAHTIIAAPVPKPSINRSSVSCAVIRRRVYVPSPTPFGLPEEGKGLDPHGC